MKTINAYTIGTVNYLRISALYYIVIVILSVNLELHHPRSAKIGLVSHIQILFITTSVTRRQTLSQLLLVILVI